MQQPSRWRRYLVVAVAAFVTGGGVGWKLHEPTSNADPDSTVHIIRWSEAERELMQKSDLLHDVQRLQEIARDARRGIGDQETLRELTEMTDRHSKHGHPSTCLPAIHDRIEMLDDALEVKDKKLFSESPLRPKEFEENFKKLFKKALAGAKALCIPAG